MQSQSKLAAVIVAAIIAGSVSQTIPAAGGREGWTGAELASIASMRWSQIGASPVDPSNRYALNADAALLGKRLFDDRGLSGNGQVACASCHIADAQFQDGRPTGQGVGIGRRRTMPVMGAAHSPFLFWDGRKDSLWAQALGPLEDRLEHGGNRVELVTRIRSHHLEAYQKVFGTIPDAEALPAAASPVGSDDERAAWARLTDSQRDCINRVFANMGKAIAAYERTLTYGPSRFDQYAEALTSGHSTQNLMTTRELRGLQVFLHQGQCSTCHNGPLLTDHAFHNTGVPPRDAKAPDPGRAEGIQKVIGDEFNCLGRYSDAHPDQCAELQFLSADDAQQLGAFRTPSLRNVANRAPYMHAGQFTTLEQVIEHYAGSPAATLGQSELARPGAKNPNRQPIRLTPSDIRDLKAFLETLTGPVLNSATD